MATVTSEQVRAELVEALRLDLVGPDNDHAFATELLPEQPSRWYLTGFLVPAGVPVEHRTDDPVQEELDFAGETDGTDDANPPEPAAARRGPLPSSMGLTALVLEGARQLTVEVTWGDYAWEGDPDPDPEEVPVGDTPDQNDESPASEAKPSGWRRTPRREELTLGLPVGRRQACGVPGSGGLKLHVMARLLALNAERAEEERLAGLAAGGNKGSKRKKAGRRQQQDGGLFGDDAQED